MDKNLLAKIELLKDYNKLKLWSSLLLILVLMITLIFFLIGLYYYQKEQKAKTRRILIYSLIFALTTGSTGWIIFSYLFSQ